MKRRTFLTLLASAVSERALAQATVVSSCGSVTLTAGSPHNVTIDANGQSCQSGASGGGAPTSVWSAADAAANAMTLSNGGLTFTNTVINKTIRGSISRTSGKLYVEFLCVITGGNYQVGLASSSFVSSSTLGSSVYSAGISYSSNSVSSGFTSNNTTIIYAVATHVVGLAVDFTTGSVWYAVDNVWVNSSNPATGTAPIISFVPATVGALFPAFVEENVNMSWTLQSTAASQKYAPPSGFTPWG